MKKSHIALLVIGFVIMALIAIDATTSNGMYVKALFSRKAPVPAIVYLKSYDKLDERCVQLAFYKPLTNTDAGDFVAYSIGEVDQEHCDAKKHPGNNIAHQVTTSDIKLSELH